MRGRWWEALLHEFEETLASMTRMTGPHHRGHVSPFSRQLGKDDDLISLLPALKTHISSFSVPKEQWPAYLLPVLSLEAREAFSLFASEMRSDLDKLEEAFHNHFHIGPETYRLKVIKLERELMNHGYSIGEDLEYGVNDGQICVYLKLVYAQMPMWLMTWVRDRSPTTREEAMRLADQHFHNCKQLRYPQNGRHDQFKKKNLQEFRKDDQDKSYNCSKVVLEKKHDRKVKPRVPGHRHNQSFIVRKDRSIFNAVSMGIWLSSAQKIPTI